MVFFRKGVHYPFRRTAHVSSGKPVESDTNLTSLGSIQPHCILVTHVSDPCWNTHARYGIRVFQCIYQTILKLFKRGVFEQYFLGTVTTRQGQSPICQLSLKGAPNCASRIFGKCKTLITSYTNYYQSSAAFHTV